MKKTIASTIFVLVFGFYALSQSSGIASSSFVTASPVANVPTVSVPAHTTPSTPTTPTEVVTPTPVVPTPKPTGMYVDGAYTGSVADAYYGNIQVRAVISGGKISDVQFLQYPNDRGTSREINAQAMPILKREAIQVQSARVNGVSGASDTSAAFRESLTSALLQAKA